MEPKSNAAIGNEFDNTIVGEQKKWWATYRYPSLAELPKDCNALEELLDADLQTKIPMSRTTKKLALESESNATLDAAWNTVFEDSETFDMLLGMTSIGSPSFDERLNTKQTSENDVQIVTDTLIREPIIRLNQFRYLGHFSRSVTQQTAVITKKAESSRSTTRGNARPDAQVIFEHAPEAYLDYPQLLLIEEKEGGNLSAALRDLRNPLRFKWSALHLGDIPFIVAVGVAGTKVQWYRISFMNDCDVVKSGFKTDCGYPLRAYQSHKVEPLDPVLNALKTTDRIKLVRWTINWVFLAHTMSKSLPHDGLNKIINRLRGQNKMIEFNTDLGFVKKTVNADLVDADALKALYKKITECQNDRDAYEEIRHIIRHTPNIRVPKLDGRGNLVEENGNIVWIKEKTIKGKRVGEESKVIEVPPEAFEEPFYNETPLGNKWIFCLTPFGYRRTPKTNFELHDALKAVLSALKFMHKNGFVHRDIRWPNIMRMSDSTWMLIDLEIATLEDQPWPEEAVLSKKFWPASGEEVWKKHHDLKMLSSILDNVEGKIWPEFKPIQESLCDDCATAESVLIKMDAMTLMEARFGDDVIVDDDDGNTSSGITASFGRMTVSVEQS